MRIAHKLSFGIACLIIGTVVLVLIVINLSVKEAFINEIQEDFIGFKKTLINLQEAKFRELKANNRIASEVPHLKAVVTTPGLDHATILDGAQQLNQIISADLLILCDTKGDFLATISNFDLQKKDISDLSPIEAVLEGRDFMGIWEIKDYVYQIVANPLVFGDEVVGGLLTGFIVDAEAVKNLETMTHSYILLFTEKTMISSVNSRNLFHLFKKEVLDKEFIDTHKVSTTTLKGEQYLFFKDSFSEQPLDYVLLLSLDKKMAFFYEIQKKIPLFLIGLLFIVYIFIRLFSKKAIQPVLLLKNGAKEISEGRFDVKVDIKSHDEIGELTTSFNQMAENLKKNTVSIDLLTKEVEERKKVQKELREAKENAEKASLAKSSFLANMSHELRTPLNAVLGFSGLLKETSPTEEQQSYIDTITTSGGHLLSLINEVLDLSKVEAGQVELEIIDFQLEDLVENVIQISKTRLLSKDVELYHRYDKSLPKFFKGDPTRIRQMLINLLNNAVKFTERGEIAILVKPDPSEYLPEKLSTIMVSLSVQDSGIGIPPENIEHIFTSFSQADTSTTRKYGGTGLGLSITKHLVELMKGEVFVESEIGKGSAFTLRIPLEISTTVLKSEKDFMDSDSLKDKCVLIVEDSVSLSFLVKEYCEELKMQVDFITNTAEKGLEWLNETQKLPDLIITDIMLPEMDGYTLAEIINRDKKLCEIKMVAISKIIQPGVVQFCKSKGFKAFLPKPIVKMDLFGVIQKVLDKGYKSKNQKVPEKKEFSCKGIKILAAEDNLINQRLIKALLGNLGCEVDIVKNGKEAVEKVKENGKNYDICLMDLQMPIMGGIEATQIIRKEVSEQFPIIAITATVIKEDEVAARDAGMNDFLTKPIELEKLKQALGEWALKNKESY